MRTGPGRLPAWRVRRVASTGSTNSDLLSAAAAGEPAGAVLVADEQTAGLGRLGRRWLTPPGSALAVSMLLRPDRVDGWLPLTTGLAVRDAVLACAPGLAVALKWPNDVLAGPRGADPTGKLAGILVQGGPAGAVVIGCGVNVTVPVHALPPRVGATSLTLLGADVDREQLLGVLLARLAVRLDAWSAGRSAVAEYRAACATLGREIAITAIDRVVTGRAVDVDTDGRLIVESADGRVALAAGDVAHVRPERPPWAS